MVTTKTARWARKARKALQQAVEKAREAPTSPGKGERLRHGGRRHFRSQMRPPALRRLPQRIFRRFPWQALALATLPCLLAMAGCGGVSANSANGDAARRGGASNGIFSISPGAAAIDTNCTGCNATNSSGATVEQLTATLNSGGAADVTWSLPGGGTDGSITAKGQYKPPSYLTGDNLKVTVTAALASNPNLTASTTISVTPGFLQPLTPENAAVGSGGTVTITGYIAEAGGTTGIRLCGVQQRSTGSSGGQGALGATNCVRGGQAFTYCTVTYTAPATVSTTSNTYVVATVGAATSRQSTVILLNAAGVDSNPANHQQQLSTPMALGASGGNNNDYDTQGAQIVGLLQRHARFSDSERERHAISAQQQSRAGAQRPGQGGRRDYSARPH